MWWWLLNGCTSTNINLTFPNSEDVLWPSAHFLVLCRSPQIRHICNYRRRRKKKQWERLTQTLLTEYCPFKNTLILLMYLCKETNQYVLKLLQSIHTECCWLFSLSFSRSGFLWPPPGAWMSSKCFLAWPLTYLSHQTDAKEYKYVWNLIYY